MNGNRPPHASGGLLSSLVGGQNDPRRERMRIVDDTRTQYPALRPMMDQMTFRQSGDDERRGLEFYQQGERDSYAPETPAVEIFGKGAQPKDLAGDIVSHYGVAGGDPALTQMYNDFEQSMTPDQQHRLREQYQWHQQNSGETRPFEDWKRISGLPAYFRGYAFGQWDHADEFYTPEQIGQFDQMNKSLTAGAPRHTRRLSELPYQMKGRTR